MEALSLKPLVRAGEMAVLATDSQSRTWIKFTGLTLDAGLTGPVVSLYNAVMSLPDKIAAVKNSNAFPLSDEGRDSSVTRSAIASGAIVITDSAAQIALTGQDPDAFIAALNRDTANTHSGALDQNPNLQMLLGSQSQMQRLATQGNRIKEI
jgi:hypothetical protein